MTYTIKIEQDEDDMFIISCLELPGCFSQGKTLKEALVNIEEAIQGYCESLEKHGEK